MTPGSLSRRYARALLEIAKEEGHVEDYGAALEALARTFSKEKRFLMAMADRAFAKRDRLKAVQEMGTRLKLPPHLRSFLLLLVQKERIGLLPDVAREFGRMRDELLGIVRVEVRTPKKPAAILLRRVESILHQSLQSKVVAFGGVDPEMIGGVIVKVGHVIYDGSIRGALHRMRERLMGMPLD